MKTNHTDTDCWESLDGYLQRRRVPGGWLYKYEIGNKVALEFVNDFVVSVDDPDDGLDFKKPKA